MEYAKLGLTPPVKKKAKKKVEKKEPVKKADVIEFDVAKKKKAILKEIKETEEDILVAEEELLELEGGEGITLDTETGLKQNNWLRMSIKDGKEDLRDYREQLEGLEGKTSSDVLNEDKQFIEKLVKRGEESLKEYDFSSPRGDESKKLIEDDLIKDKARLKEINDRLTPEPDKDTTVDEPTADEPTTPEQEALTALDTSTPQPKSKLFTEVKKEPAENIQIKPVKNPPKGKPKQHEVVVGKGLVGEMTVKFDNERQANLYKG